MPQRAPPLTPLVLQALLGIAAYHEDWSFVAVTAVGFHCILRTVELASFGFLHVEWNQDYTAVLNLGYTKGGKRRGVTESVTVDDPLVGKMIAKAASLSGNAALIWDGGCNSYRKNLYQYLELLGISCLNIKAYSLRRGGASYDYLLHGNMTRTLTRGRWESLKTGKLYINDAAAREF